MKIFTSYYKKISEDSHGLIAVRISTIQPSWFTSCNSAIPELYPGMQMVNDYKSGRLSDEEYIIKYKKKLSELDADKIIRKLEKLSHTFGDRDVVLLCYEAPGKLCHRHLVAKWLSYNTTYDVKEL